MRDRYCLALMATAPVPRPAADDDGTTKHGDTKDLPVSLHDWVVRVIRPVGIGGLAPVVDKVRIWGCEREKHVIKQVQDKTSKEDKRQLVVDHGGLLRSEKDK